MDDEDTNTLVVIYASIYTLRLFVSCRAIFLDGTFKMAPKLWKQLLIINVELDEHISFPVTFAFLPNKKKETYEKVLGELKTLVQDLGIGELAAAQAMADFEQAIRLAWTAVFPNVPLKNCLFHFNKVQYFCNNYIVMKEISNSCHLLGNYI